jgi:hypothetical protein
MLIISDEHNNDVSLQFISVNFSRAHCGLGVDIRDTLLK